MFKFTIEEDPRLHSQGILDYQKYLMGFYWVIPTELDLLDAFGEVVYVDTVEGTNNEERPLLTCGGKDSEGKYSLLVCAVTCQIKNLGFSDGSLA